MLWKLLDGPLRERPKMYGVAAARDVHLMVLALQMTGSLPATETAEFARFSDWVVARYRGGHTTSWWGAIDANAVGDGVGLLFQLLDEYRVSAAGRTKSA